MAAISHNLAIESQVPFANLREQYWTLTDEITAAVHKVLARCDFILGAAVEEFEQDFAAFVGTSHAVGVSSGLDALRLALLACEIGPGDEVILPANTYIATALAVSSVGARPVLVDCDPDTYTMDVTAIPAVISPRTRAIIPVHLTGQCADMDPILSLAGRHNLHVIEDASQAHGARYKGRPCGSLGEYGCFSFYPGKNLGAAGDGGMVTTHEPVLAERLQSLRNYGQKVKYVHQFKGLNARLDTLQAAILQVKLPHLNQWNQARYAHAQRYRELLSDVGDIVLQTEAAFSTHVYHLFIVETDYRDGLQEYLNAANIQTGIHYPIPVHLQEAYADLGYHKGDFPYAESLAGRMLSLPMFPEMSDEQIDHVVTKIREFYAHSVRQ